VRLRLARVEGKAGAPVTVVSLPARGRPPQAAVRRAGLEDVEEMLTGKQGRWKAVLYGHHMSSTAPPPT